MVLFIILGVIILITVVVLSILFVMLGKENQKKEDANAVPLKDINQIKKELFSGLLEPQKPVESNKQDEIIPAFVLPKTSIDPIVPVTERTIEVPRQAEQEVKQAPVEEDAFKKRTQELEEELRTIKQKAEEQADVAREMIVNLTKENLSLKNQQANVEEAKQGLAEAEAAKQKLDELEGEASTLKIENANLQNQLESTNAKVHLLEEEMAAVKIQMGEEISRANATVTELKREKEELLSAPKPEPEPDGSILKELELLKSEQILLKQKCQDLDVAHQKSKELNAELAQKNDALQYELVKARAQSSGLERVSFNYKNQLEDFLKKVNAAQTINDQLSEAKNRLEGMVNEVKLQNEQLSQKDQLTQFELEKNRSRLVSLERECEDLKVRMQKGSE